MLKLLLNNGADPNAEPGGTLPAFHYWLLNENTDSYLETVKIMLEHGANPTVSDQWNSWTALHYFAWHGTDVDVFEMLMDHSVDGTKPNST
jgi:ankyrin repeat protein